MKKNTKLILSGGLGNQLFQICAGISIEKNKEFELLFDISNLIGKKTVAEPGNYTRLLEVGELIPDSQIFHRSRNWIVDALLTRIKKNYLSRYFVFENGPLDDSLRRVNSKTREIYGFFQNSELVENTWDELIYKLKTSPKFSPLIKSLPMQRIAIHLRFGDYSDDKKTKSLHGLTDFSYYKEAIEFFQTDFEGVCQLLVVTDDVNKAKEMFKSFDERLNLNFVSNSEPLADLVELARSSHLIISNSTFSWWGAWIASKIHNSKVIYPRPWFADPLDPELPIFVKSWKSLNRIYST